MFTNTNDKVALIYTAFFGRSPDPSGLKYWADRIDTGTSFIDIARGFTSSDEAKAKYTDLSDGVINTPDQFLTAVYANLFGREPDPAGLAFWTNAINNGLPVEDALITIALGAQGSDLTILEGKVSAGLRYTVLSEAAGTGYDAAESTQVLNSVGQAGGLDGALDKAAELALPEPTVITVPGPTVFVPGPVIDKPDVISKTFGSVPTQFDTDAGTIFFGDQTTPSTGQSSVYDPTSGSFIAVSVMPRQSDGGTKYIPISSSFDGVTLTIDHLAPSGPQSLANGSFANRADRGAVNTNTTFGDTQGLKAAIEGGAKVYQAWDTDATAAVNQIKLLAFVAGDGTIDFAQVGGGGAITDNGGNDFVVSNSQQQNFFVPTGVAALTQGAQFQNEFWIEDAAGVRLVGIVENITLGAPGYSPADQIA